VPAVNYKVTREELVSQATWFALMGLGMKPATIQRYYSPKALQLLAS
jgi:hypothetical protein